MTIFIMILSAGLVLPLGVQNQPERVIMVVIDGLHAEAPDRVAMPVFAELASLGTLVRNTTVIMPGHPTHGEYARVHTCSFPNPVMMTGTIFLKPNQQMLQHGFQNSAFIANSRSYPSITAGYHFIVQRDGTDAFAIDQAIAILKDNDIDFMRIHLQNTGSAGNRSLSASSDEPFLHNIWHEDAPYVHAVAEADRQLGRMIEELKRMGKWEGTLFVVTSDHGQTESGWHPILPEESWLHPTLFHGPGIRQNHTIEWADQTDVIPTIADIMQVPPPNSDGGSGRILHAVKLSPEHTEAESASRLLELNRILVRYMLAEAELTREGFARPQLNTLVMRAQRRFYGLDRIMEWPQMDSIDALIQHNAGIVAQMEKDVQASKTI